ncbi:NAD(P)/FAD-dependent oxidoreductase [Halogeometricum borinquense]|uniref:NAD(P)/FAD-dependent oxidoreductase n=1 Tax=Halogeometricum borinquense TaxID=60847 RepID=A0A6C0UJU7_9EURY|nr:NAD(P)/FAD-dependent oxidoreductase [Halogeometricum borinquense]QIB75450.1 NAD(P)/FAD-dependent oxidoreductase [Halogeometricum borinquense]QIQ75717.1 NAD(P)/FAD-dependent oxidoreductase [Halogeometricum borinquense]
MIGVVGGGIAGLAAAYRLRQHGYDVQVFEATDDVGGLAAVYETDGDDIEKFYHHLSKSEETIVELAQELGLGNRLEWKIGKNSYYVDGTAHPLDTAWQIAAYPHMSLYDKFRLGMLTQGIDVRGGIPDFDAYNELSEYEHVSIRDFVVEHTTRGVYENFVDPLLDGKFGHRKDDISAAWFLGRIRFRGERDLLRGEILGYFDGGFRPLLDALVDAVGRENITTGARVTELATDGESVDSLTVATADGTTTHDVDSVVVAAMPNVLEDLTGYECDIEFQGAVCGLVTMSESLLDTYWLNVAHDAPFGSLIEHTNFIPKERYGGDHLLYIASYVQSREEELWQMDDDEVEELWLDEIESMYPDFDRSTVEEFRIARNPRAGPIYERGYLDLVVPYDLGDEVSEGVYYAGMASASQYPERSLNGGIVAGYECADRIAQKRRPDPDRESVPADD